MAAVVASKIFTVKNTGFNLDLVKYRNFNNWYNINIPTY